MNISSSLNIFLVCTAAIVASTPNLHCNAARLHVPDMEELLDYTETDKLADTEYEPWGSDSYQYPPKDEYGSHQYDHGTKGSRPEDKETSEGLGDDTGSVVASTSNDIIDEDLNLVQTEGGRFECPRVKCLHGSETVCRHRGKCSSRRGHCRKVKVCCPTCKSSPTFCPSVYDPVCCNGKTYSSQCDAGKRHCRRGRCH